MGLKASQAQAAISFIEDGDIFYYDEAVEQERTMSKNQWLINQELVSLVTHTVQAIAKAKGYATYPEEDGVRLVLQALYLVNIAIKAKEGKHGLG